jgi:hypothetical protein
VELGNFEDSFASDPTKTIFKIRGVSGFEVSDYLDVLRINIEKAT